MCNHRNILTIHTRWQPNEVKLQVFKDPQGGPDASGDKNSFSRIMDLSGQIMLAECCRNFIDISILVSIHNLSHLLCTLVSEEMQKLKNGACQGARKYQATILGFP